MVEIFLQHVPVFFLSSVDLGLSLVDVSKKEKKCARQEHHSCALIHPEDNAIHVILITTEKKASMDTDHEALNLY